MKWLWKSPHKDGRRFFQALPSWMKFDWVERAVVVFLAMMRLASVRFKCVGGVYLPSLIPAAESTFRTALLSELFSGLLYCSMVAIKFNRAVVSDVLSPHGVFNAAAFNTLLPRSVSGVRAGPLEGPGRLTGLKSIWLSM